jgi:hypothetical protein
MTVAEQLNAIKKALSEWTDVNGGSVVVASNLRDLWQQASLDSQSLRILICYQGQRMRRPFSEAAILLRVDRTFNVAVTRGRGYSANRGASVSETVGNTDPFVDQLGEIVDLIRNMVNVAVEYPVDYKGDKAMQLGNLVIDGYLEEFSLAVDLPELTVKGT